MSRCFSLPYLPETLYNLSDMKSLILPFILLSSSLSHAKQTTANDQAIKQGANDSLFQAIARGDANRVSMTMAEADPNARNTSGNTALMVATQLGNFEVIRQLLWSGADPRLKNTQGKTAIDFIQTASRDALSNELMIRCYSFVLDEAKPNTSPLKNPHRAIVSDGFVESNHPLFSKRFIRNIAELNGKSGVDDDNNGFIDDIDGWNVINDRPSEIPKMGITTDPENRATIAAILKLRETKMLSNNRSERNIATYKLKKSHTNPLVKIVGSEIYSSAGLDLNDDAFATMFGQASHGNHVAGIIYKASQGQCELACSNIFNLDSPADHPCQDTIFLYTAAVSSPTFEDFVKKVLIAERNLAIKRGRRASEYLQYHSAGVVNMSWVRPSLINTAANLGRFYKDNAKNPTSVDDFYKNSSISSATELGLELKIANSAAFAVVFAENPNVLFTISAGNISSSKSIRNNDVTLISPPYLSAFFPNVITVASHDGDSKLSNFSYYGKRSVQIAAPGRDINSSMLAGFYGSMSGTSMAAPYVAGIAAKIRADNPKLTARQIRNILEQTADPVPSYKHLLTSGGKINPSRAFEVAKSNSEHGLSIYDLPKFDISPASNSSTAFRGKFQNTNPNYRITSLASVGDQWGVVASTSPTKISQQINVASGSLDIPWLKEMMSKGYHISSVGGDMSSWSVVLNTGRAVRQNLHWNIKDFNILADQKALGYGIADIAGTSAGWILLFEPLEDLGEQRYTYPSPLNQSRIEWITSRYKEGYMITALAGNDQVSDENDGWVIVMSKKHGYTNQKVTYPGAWPTQFIQENAAQGFKITDIAGSPGNYVVVMSKGTNLENQIFIKSSTPGFPKDQLNTAK